MISCNPANFTRGRAAAISYVVIHYTANNADTAQNNCTYFKNNQVGASAHYFVDENGWQQSVDDTDTAWHCGATQYVHDKCRNANSIGVELCSRVDARGAYYFLPETVRHAQALVRLLLGRYGLAAERVVRHYDVTGKLCPAPFVKNVAAWQAFLAEVKEEKKLEEKNRNPSPWAQEAAIWAVRNKLFQGGGTDDFRWHEPITREELAVVLKRMSTLQT